jgi:hypothetical protein
MTEFAGRPPARFALGVAVPLAVVALAYALWWTSDRLMYIGPLDRAAFGWAVVIPVWVAAPVAAGFAWYRLTPRLALLAAAVVGATISGAAAALFWQAVAEPSCEFGAIRTAGLWVLPSLILGAVIGGGLAASALIATRLVREGHPWRGVVLGAASEAVMVFAAILVAGAMMVGSGCQRPAL